MFARKLRAILPMPNRFLLAPCENELDFELIQSFVYMSYLVKLIEETIMYIVFIAQCISHHTILYIRNSHCSVACFSVWS